MTPAARLSAAIEVIAAIDDQRVPAARALKEWGTAHRFAGSGDRAAISGLIYDALRRQASSIWLMDDDSPRARVLGMLVTERKLDVGAIAALFDGSRFAPLPLTDGERNALSSRSLADAPPHVAGDYPEWLDGHLAAVFGEDRVAEAAAMASRAPLDLRVNTLRATREKALAALAHLGAVATPWSPLGIRIQLSADARNPGVQAEEIFIKGGIEVQDEGSQLAALFTGARPGEQVIDLCAGAGGKTLALAAMMQGKGRLIATDRDKRQLAPIHARLSRAGVHNVEVRSPKGAGDGVSDIGGTADLVLVDAPCTGTGTWRRSPDAKWRMRPGALEIRLREQAEVLDRAAALVRPGGRIAYVTCSVLGEENGAQARAFLDRHAGFAVVPPEQVAGALWDKADDFLAATRPSPEGLLMTPHRTGTDGFFVSILHRTA
ncbi:MAG: RsmB/NOP family class I SAM-dependent RNA methyltransferase [Xanthobacteraceae bacterium]|nr:RsmB/NOP family class I SAM-dependent RNA methyltransferase [Xanthobacteraceae bacterium]